MMDPRPWLEEDATKLEKALLLAGRTDGPRKGAASRLLAAIEGLPDAPLVSAAPRALVKPVAPIRWAKIALFAMGVGGAGGVTYHLARPHGVVPSAVAPASVISQTAPLAAPGEALAPAEAPVSAESRGVLAVPREAEPDLVPAEGSAAVRRVNPTGQAREAPREATLGDETRALDRARAALDTHRPSEVLRLLDDYHRRFPQGRLRPEALVLRLAALVQAGRRDAANSLASQLLANPAYEAYAARIRSLVGEAKP
jgi:hypothetical protein